MSVIMFDVDGVLANFTTAFTTVGNRLFDTPIVDNHEQPTWDFRESLTQGQQNQIWKEIKTINNWWESLLLLVPYGTFYDINISTLKHEVYFVTHRMHSLTPAGEQTVNWLKTHGISNPRVIVSKHKGEIAKAVGANFSLEDNWGNACAIHWLAEDCESVLIERLYNAKARDVIPKNIRVVPTVNDFLKYMEDENYEGK